jgi:hypothetical protein
MRRLECAGRRGDHRTLLRLIDRHRATLDLRRRVVTPAVVFQRTAGRPAQPQAREIVLLQIDRAARPAQHDQRVARCPGMQ